MGLSFLGLFLRVYVVDVVGFKAQGKHPLRVVDSGGLKPSGRSCQVEAKETFRSIPRPGTFRPRGSLCFRWPCASASSPATRRSSASGAHRGHSHEEVLTLRTLSSPFVYMAQVGIHPGSSWKFCSRSVPSRGIPRNLPATLQRE